MLAQRSPTIPAGFTEEESRLWSPHRCRDGGCGYLAKKFGSTVTATYWTIGHYDVVAMIDAPDDQAVTGLLLSLGAAGNVRTQTLRAFSADQMGQILAKMK